LRPGEKQKLGEPIGHHQYFTLGHGIGILAIRADERVKDVSFTEDLINVDLMDGRTITVPLIWYPRLFNATPEQRAQWEVCSGGYSIRWEAIDEDLSTEGMLRRAPAPIF
jgi:Protein of unknown function (DUF2442)